MTVAGRPRYCACTLGSDLQQAAGGNPCDGATARAQGNDIQTGQGDPLVWFQRQFGGFTDQNSNGEPG